MKLVITRLEQALRCLEDGFFLESITSRFGLKHNIPDPRPALQDMPERILPWQDLRGDLLSLTPAQLDAKYADAEWIDFVFGSLAELPHELSEWTRNSRRVFFITRELQTLLTLTSFEKITWGDIPWPFRSFVVALEDPITTNIHTSMKAVDTVLVSRFQRIGEDGDYIKFRLLSSVLDSVTPLSWHDRQRLEQSLRKPPNLFLKEYDARAAKSHPHGPINAVLFFSEESLRTTTVTDSFMPESCVSQEGALIGAQVEPCTRCWKNS